MANADTKLWLGNQEALSGDYHILHPVTHSLRGEGFDASEDGTGRGTPIVPVAFSSKDYGNDATDDLSPTLRSIGHDKSDANGGEQMAIAFQERGRTDGRNVEWQDDLAYSLNAPNGGGRRQELNIAAAWQVRRLTPTERHRLQGFPDDHCAIDYRGKNAADGPQYKALGNSWAKPNGAWIIARIAERLAA